MRLRKFLPWVTPLVAATVLAACGGDSILGMMDDNNNEATSDPRPLLVSNARKAAVSDAQAVEFAAPVCGADGKPTREGGGNYRVAIPSASGETIVFQVFEPAAFNCEMGAPLVLDGHGYGGSRRTSTGSTVAEVIVPNIAGDLVAANMGVISIDQRGFGESTGTVRVMDPDFEGQDLLAILDWAEANLDWLRYRLEKPTPTASDEARAYNLMLGATGSSYGGGYQFLIHNIDPKGRMDAMTPDITWNDLRSSLNPGATYARAEGTRRAEDISAKGGVKAGWVLGLVGLGEVGARSMTPQDGQDPLILETLANGLITNLFPEGALNFFRYHSPSYYCDSEPLGAMTFPVSMTTVTPLTLKTKPRGVDMLITQGMRDTLFPFNEAAWNFKCYKDLLKADGSVPDVRLFTHQSGHILPVSVESIPALGPALTTGLSTLGLISLPEFQSPAGAPVCQGTQFGDAQFLFLAEKLLNDDEFDSLKQGLNERRAAALAALDDNKGKVCLSANDSTGAGVYVSEDTFFKTLMPAAKGDLIRTDGKVATGTAAPSVDFGFKLPAPIGATVPVAGNLVTGLGTSLLPAAVSSGPLQFVRPMDGGDVFLAGIPAGTVTIAPADGQFLKNPACEEIQSAGAQLPLNLTALTPGCDPIVLLGLGIRRAGQQAATLIDDQLVPVRGYGTRHVEFTGIAERIAPNDQLVVMAYAFHPQYVVTGSRDLLSLGVQVSGNVQLPLVAAGAAAAPAPTPAPGASSPFPFPLPFTLPF